MTDPASPWRRQELPPGGSTSLPVGPLTLRLRRQGDELWIGTRPTPGAEAPERTLPESGWTRWALPAGPEVAIHLSPGLPDRLVVVEPQVPFRLAPGADARVYIRVPVWVQLRLGDRGGPLLGEFPTLLMSNTWWGDMADGSLGYWLETSARRSLTPDLLQPHLAVCAMELSNRSREPLPVDKIALRVIHLSVFGTGAGLWCEEVRVRYQGGDDSHVEMSGRPPAEAEDAILLTPPRVPADRGLRARTFARLMGGGHP
jgi:hypothetical protein